MAHNVLSYGSPEAARRAQRAINQIAQDGGFSGVKPVERRQYIGAQQTTELVDEGYNSYFKIIGTTEIDDTGKLIHKVRVVDGATYQGDLLNNYNLMQFNNILHSIPACEFIIDSVTYKSVVVVCLSKSFYVTLLDKVPSAPEPAGVTYRQIGRVRLTDDSIEIVQEHISGVLIVDTNWYTGPFAVSVSTVNNTFEIKGGIVYAGDVVINITDTSLPYTDASRYSIYVGVVCIDGSYTGTIYDNKGNNIPNDPANNRWSYRIASATSGKMTQEWLGGNLRISDRWV